MQEMNKFFTANPGINLKNADLFSTDALAQYNWPDDADRKTLLQSLRIRQRLLKVSPDDSVATALERAGLHSAHHIASLSIAAFAQKAMPELVAIPDINNQQALCAKIHANATRIHRAAFELALAKPRTMQLAVVTPSGQGDNPDFQEGIPDYQRLFGPMITCDCEECQSIYGPAAYFTDLMRVVSQYVVPPLEELFQLQYRRPDLWTMPLDCTTAETEVSYLDIVNGILKQNLQANNTGGDDPLHTAAAMTYPFSTPFNADLVTIRSGMQGMNTSLAELHKLLNTSTPAAAAAALNLSPEQLSLITGETNTPLSQLYGFRNSSISSTDLCDTLSVQKIFLQQSGLQPEQLDALIYQNLKQGEETGNEMNPELLHNLFLNRLQTTGQYIVLNSSSADTTTGAISVTPASIQLATTSTNTTTYTPLNDAALNQLAVYIRLQAATGWTFEELDWVLVSITSADTNTIDDDTIKKLGQVAALKNKYNIPFDELCSFWYQMKTYGRGNGATPADLYDRIYNTPPLFTNSTSTQPAYYRPTIDPTGASQNPLFRSHVITWYFNDAADSQNQRLGTQLAAALGISADALYAIVNFVAPGAASLYLNLSHMSMLYRVSRLAQMLKMSIPDFISLCTVAGIAINTDQPFCSINHVISLCEMAEWMHKSKISISQLRYLTSAIPAPATLRLADAETITKALNNMVASDTSTLVTPLTFVNDDVDALKSQALYDLLLAEKVIDNNGLVLLNEKDLTPGSILTILTRNEEVAAKLFPLGTTFPYLSFSTNDNGKATFSFDPFANQTIQDTNSFTISFWVKPDYMATNGWPTMVGYNEGTDVSTKSPTLCQVKDNPGTLSVGTAYNGVNYSNHVENFFANTTDWVYVTWVNDKGNWRVYRNALLMPFTIPAATIPGIYKEQTTDAYAVAGTFDGNITNLAIWTTARTAEQVAADIMNDNLSGDPDLLAWWPMNEATGDTIHNHSENSEATDGTLTGSYTWETGQFKHVTELTDYISELLTNALAAQNTLVIKTLSGVAGVSADTMKGICILTAQQVDNAVIFTGLQNPPEHYPYAPNMLLYPGDKYASERESYLAMLQRNTAMTRWFRLTGAEAGGIADYSKTFGSNAIAYGTYTYSISQLMMLGDYTSLQKLCNETNGLMEYFSIADAGTNAPSGSQLELLAQLTGWNLDEITAIVHEPGFSDVNFNTIPGLRKLADVMAFEAKTGSGIATLTLIQGLSEQNLFSTTVDVSEYWQQYTDASASVLAMTGSKSGKTAANKLAGGLAEQTREVLCDWLIWALNEDISGVKNKQELYEYLLIDVNMSANVKTSWTVAAMNSLQLYVNRIISNLEPGAVNKIPEIWWKWMSTYRVWQANREVYLYPENYVDPTLRKFQSPEFKSFISNISKGPVTDDNVKEALAAYLESVNDVASLKIVDGYVDKVRENTPGISSNNEQKVIFLVGKSRAEPATFYTRIVSVITNTMAEDNGVTTADASNMLFGPWSEINFQINSAYVSTVIAFGRQFIFWTQQTTITDTDSENKKFTSVYATIYYSYRDFSGKWQAPATFVKDILIETYGSNMPAFDYYTDYLVGANLVEQTSGKQYAYYKSKVWNKLKVQALPATATSAEKILVTFGDIINCPASMDTMPEKQDTSGMSSTAAAYQNMLYNAALRAYKFKGYYTTIIPAYTLSNAMEVEGWNISMDMSNIVFINYQTMPMNSKTGIVFYNETPGTTVETGTIIPAPEGYWPMFLNFDLINSSDKTFKSFYTDTPGNFQSTPSALTGITPKFPTLNVVDFDGSQTASIPWEAYGTLTTFTVSCWVYINGSTVYDQNILTLIYSWSSGSSTFAQGGWDISVCNGQFQFGIGRSGGENISNNFGTAVGNEWYFLALTVYSSDHIVATINDSCYTLTGAYVPLPANAVINLGIGTTNGSNYTYGKLNGSVANLKIWNSPLTQEQLQSEYFAKGNSLHPNTGKLAHLGNSVAGFFYNKSRQSYLALPDYETTLLNDVLQPVYQPDSQTLWLTVSGSPVPTDASVSMKFVRVNTDTIPVLIRKLATGGLHKMLEPAMQYLPEEKLDLVALGDNILYPDSSLMDFNGAFGIYFWEIFFYAPYLIAEKLRTGRKFDEAEKWYQCIFNPTSQLGPVGCWQLNRTVNNKFPDMNQGLPATYSGITALPNQTVKFDYNPRSIWQFRPASTPQVIVPYSAELNPDTFTISAWIQINNLPSGFNTIVNSQQGSTGYHLYLNYVSSTTTCLTFIISTHNATYLYANSYSFSKPEKWLQVAATYDGNYMNVYIDGVNLTKDRPLADNTFIKNQSASFKIGSGNSSGSYGNYFDGQIADVMLLDYPMSDTELLNLHKDYKNFNINANYWNFRPFRRVNAESLYHILNGDTWQESFYQPAQYYTASLQMAIYEYDPFDPDTIARLRINSWQKATFMRYIDNLLSWGDSLFTQDTWETLSDATMRYVLASTLLGKTPVKTVAEEPQTPVTYNDIMTAYGNNNVPPFLIEMENELSGLGADASLPGQVQSIVDAYFCIPSNKQLLKYWELVADRLYKIRHGLTITGAQNSIPLYAAPINPMALVAAKANSNFSGASVSAMPAIPAFRFSYMIAQARSVTAEVTRLGSELLSALEKKDAEHLSGLQAGYQLVLNNMSAQIKANQINQLQYIASGLQASLENAKYMYDTYKRWLLRPVNAEESLALNQLHRAVLEQDISMGVKTVAVFSYLLPTIFGFADGGFNPGESLNATSGVADIAGQILNTQSQQTIQTAQFIRREEEWELQLNINANQVKEITAQISANNFELKAAQQELAMTITQTEQSQETYQFLKTKFTNEELYEWMSGQLSTLYTQFFQLAWSLAQSAQAALQYELNITGSYLNNAVWNASYQGLLAGDALYLSLQQMENAYMTRTSRNLEIRKTWSMRQNNPQALLTLISTGNCRFDIDELSYDMDFPGHYNRKIKSLSITIPAVVGPYQNIHATLTQTGNKVCTKPDIEAVKYLLGLIASPPATGNSVRINWNPNQEIAISTGINDAGIFQINFNDEQYLPFEGTGAVSSWNLDIPQASNAFPLRSISDVIVTVDYTAQDGGSTFTSQVTSQPPLTNYKGWQYLSMRQLYSVAWFNFCNNPDGATFSLPFELVEKMYPANLDKGSVMLGNNDGMIGLLPVLQKDYDGPLPDFSMIDINNNATYWSTDTGLVPVSTNETQQAVPGIGNPWTIWATIPGELLTDGKIDPAKFQDIILIIPFSGELSWG